MIVDHKVPAMSPIVLASGPPQMWWFPAGTALGDRVTIDHYGRHEHFERTGMWRVSMVVMFPCFGGFIPRWWRNRSLSDVRVE
jgi:hypothetical protein